MRPEMMRPTPACRYAVALLALAGLVGGCGSSSATHPARQTHVLSARQRLARLRKHLPYGFTAPGHAVGAQSAGELSVAPARSLRMSQIALQPLPSRAQLGEAIASVINEPGPLVLHALFTSTSTIRPGGTVIVAATQLGASAGHDALLVLQGPGGRFEHLLGVRGGVAAAVVTLPAELPAGTYFLVAEDLSEDAGSAGRVLVDIGSLLVR